MAICRLFLLAFILAFAVCTQGQAVVADFSFPSPVCAGEPVAITNNSSGASSYKWNFCSKNLNQAPASQNLGSFGGLLEQPTYIDVVFANNNYYGFVTNFSSGNLIRLDFGKSLLNAPTAVNLGNINGLLPSGGLGGIRVVQDQGKWYAIIVAGYPPGGINPRIMKIDFGTNITNATPFGTNWGNAGNMYDPNDLILEKEGNNWIAFTVSGEHNTITRFNFGSSLDNSPIGDNLGNLGNLGEPAGLFFTVENGNKTIFVTNSGDKTRIGGQFNITRLNFGSSLLNMPGAFNIGNVGNMLQHPRDIVITRFCNETTGFILNAHPFYNSWLKLGFPGNDITSLPSANDIGRLDGFDYPNSIAGFYNEGSALIALVTNRNNNTITRIVYADCSAASIAGSLSKDPPPLYYSEPGIYNIQLTVNEGTSSETTVCKEIVVNKCHEAIISTNDTTVCAGSVVQIKTRPADTYTWYPATFLNDPASASPIVTAHETMRYYVDAMVNGEHVTDSIMINVKIPYIKANDDTIICAGTPVQLNVNQGAFFTWSPATGLSNSGIPNPIATPDQSIAYSVVGIDPYGCLAHDTVNITVRKSPEINVSKSNDVSCDEPMSRLQASGGNTYSWAPINSLTNVSGSTTIATPDTTTTYTVTGTDQAGCSSSATITVEVGKTGSPKFVLPNVFSPNNDGKNDCFGIERWGNVRIRQFQVYNRWGDIIFQTKDPSQCWDGTWQGKQQAAGGYIYVINASTICGEVKLKGVITLIH